MAGHDDRDRVGGVGSADGSRGSLIPKLVRQLSVRSSLAKWDLLEEFPNLMLEVRASWRQLKFEVFTLPVEVLPKLLVDHSGLIGRELGAAGIGFAEVHGDD